jgi:1-acyl-sn-glycerol-3-phosphate acyltransferase
MLKWLRSLLFTGFFWLWTLLYALFFCIAAPWGNFSWRSRLARVWAHTLLNALRILCRLDYQIEGLERLPRGNHIALWKHSSSWETIAMTVVFPPQVWVLKRELTWIPIVGWGIQLLRSIAIDRKSGRSAVSQILEQGKQRLAEGLWIIIFPEGTRVAAGEIRRYGSSGALLANETGKLLVPVAHDAGRYWPRRGLVKEPGTIRVVIGPPIDAAGRTPREVNDQAQSWIESQLQQMS